MKATELILRAMLAFIVLIVVYVLSTKDKKSLLTDRLMSCETFEE